MNRPAYNPAGLATDKPINLRLMPEERQDAQALAEAAGISMSKLARSAYLKGLPIVCTELSLPIPTSSGSLDGAAAIAAPSSFSAD